jgi:hypothetical protein
MALGSLLFVSTLVSGLRSAPELLSIAETLSWATESLKCRT